MCFLANWAISQANICRDRKSAFWRHLKLLTSWRKFTLEATNDVSFNRRWLTIDRPIFDSNCVDQISCFAFAQKVYESCQREFAAAEKPSQPSETHFLHHVLLVRASTCYTSNDRFLLRILHDISLNSLNCSAATTRQPRQCLRYALSLVLCWLRLDNFWKVSHKFAKFLRFWQWKVNEFECKARAVHW